MAREVYGTNAEVVEAYLKAWSDRGRSSNGNLYFDGDVLYSYGSHFPMAVRRVGYYVVNGDRYSSTTSQHQSLLFQRVPNSSRLEVPFSALAELGRNGSRSVWGSTYRAVEVAKKMIVIDWQADRWVDTGRVDKDGMPIHEHVLGGSLFRIGKDYWVSSLDPSGLGNGLYFLTKISPTQMKRYGKPTTVSQAMELLKPEQVKEAEVQGRPVYRQGEWYFIEYDGEVSKDKIRKKYQLAHRDRSRERRHYVTEGLRIPHVGQVVRGIVRHGLERRGRSWSGELVMYRDRPEHRQLKLYDEGTKTKDRKWFLALESPQVVSYAASGSVD